MLRMPLTVRQKLVWFGDATRTKLWPLPCGGIVLALAGAVGLTHLDGAIDTSLPNYFTTWIFGGDADAARAILGSLATSLITVTSLTFSLTVVTLQLASSQFSPRLLRTFTRDRFVQGTLALFLGTFVFTLTVLRTVRTGTDGAAEFVPRISVTTTYLLTIASVIGLVAFLAHLAEEIRVETMLQTVHFEASETVRRTLSDTEGSGGHFRQPAAETAIMLAARSGFITNVVAETLVKAAEELDAVILLDRPIGSSVVLNTPAGLAWASDETRSLTDDHRQVLQENFDYAVQIGFERTSVDDIGYGLRQLTDVAAKALSPGINDPTTATHALGHSAALLCQLAGLPLGDELIRDEQRTLRVVLRRPDLAELLELAVDQPRSYGAREPQVIERLFGMLREVAWVTTRPDHREALRHELERLRWALDKVDVDSTQRARYERLHGDVENAIQGRWFTREAGSGA